MLTTINVCFFKEIFHNIYLYQLDSISTFIHGKILLSRNEINLKSLQIKTYK